MFHQFRPKIRVYGNRRDGCSCKATLNCLISHDIELVGLQNFYLGFSKCIKFSENFHFFNILFLFFKIFPFKIKMFKKTYLQYVRGEWLMNMCTQFQVDIFKNG